MEKGTTVRLWMRPELKQQLVKKAQELGISASELGTFAINEHLNHGTSPKGLRQKALVKQARNLLVEALKDDGETNG